MEDLEVDQRGLQLLCFGQAEEGEEAGEKEGGNGEIQDAKGDEKGEEEREGNSEEGTTDDPLTRVQEEDDEDTTAEHRWNTRTRNKAKVAYPK